MIGQVLGHYRVLSLIGRGGMGEVLEAEDTRLGRIVAIKVLPATVASDPDRRARFEREARAVAALNHPNIVTLHSVEEANGTHFITMERVAGRPLSELISGHGMPVRRVLDLAIQMADAVSAAHLQGITHRDLKPDNIMVTDDGRVKILDFGLAKLHELAAPMLSQMPTVHQGTEAGAILGTVAYMSPEQAEGKSVDARSDVFSLGVILYEMTTAKRPFEGESHASTMAAILRDTPPSVTEINRSIPRELARLVRLCLAKDPMRRCQSALDLRNQLEEIRREMDSGELGPVPAGGPALRRESVTPRWRVPVLITLAAVALGAMVWVALKTWNQRRPAAKVHLTQLTDQQGVEDQLSLAPDGKTFAYVRYDGDNSDIFVQRVGGGTPVNVTSSPNAEGGPAFSPDGERIAYHAKGADGGLFVMGAMGESRRRLTTFGFHPSWSPDGKEIAFCEEGIEVPQARNLTSALWVVEVASGKTRKLYANDAVQPAWSPDGRRIAFWAVPPGTGQRDILTISSSGGDPVSVTKDEPLDWNPVWSADGKYLFFGSDRGGAMNLWKVRMGPSGRPASDPEPVTTETAANPAFVSVAAKTGALAYSAFIASSNIGRIPFDPVRGQLAGNVQWVTRGTGRFQFPDPSPDGQWVAFAGFVPREDVWVSRSDGTDLRRITDDSYRDRKPRWAPDGKKLAFYSNRGGSYNIWFVNADGSGLVPFSSDQGNDVMWPLWSPRGDQMLGLKLRQKETYLFDPAKPWAEQKPELLSGMTTDGLWLQAVAWSADGRYLAGMLIGAEGGPEGVAVYDLQTRSIRKVSEHGRAASWFPDSKRLLIVTGKELLVIEPWTGEARTLPLPEPLDIGGYSIALSSDGRTIYFSAINSEADIWMMTTQ